MPVSTLELANAIPCQHFVGLTIALMKKLQLVWNSAAEILTDTMHENHITLVVKNLLWLPVKYRIMCKVLVINLQVLKLTWVWIPQRHSGTIQPQSFSLVSVNWISSFWLKTLSYRAFLVFARSSWNSLTMEVRLADSLTCSKSELKVYIFRSLIRMYKSYTILSLRLLSLFTYVQISECHYFRARISLVSGLISPYALQEKNTLLLQLFPITLQGSAEKRLGRWKSNAYTRHSYFFKAHLATWSRSIFPGSTAGEIESNSLF